MKKILLLVTLFISAFSFNNTSAQCGASAGGIANAAFYDVASCGTITPTLAPPASYADLTSSIGGPYQTIAASPLLGASSGQSSNFSFSWVQNSDPNATSAKIYVGTSTLETETVPGSSDGITDASGAIYVISVYDDAGTLVCNCANPSGLTPGATYYVSISVTLYNYSEGPNGIYNSTGATTLQSDDCQGTACVAGSVTSPFNEGDISLESVAVGVQYKLVICPTRDFTSGADLCPSEEDWVIEAGPLCGFPEPFTGVAGVSGTLVDGWLEVSTSPTAAVPVFTLAADGELEFADFIANNPTLSSSFFDATCADFPQNIGVQANNSCDPVYYHMHFIVFDYDIDRGGDGTGGEYNDACGDYVVSTVVYPEPQAPLVTTDACIWTITGACPNDIITITNTAALPGSLTGNGTNVITYTPSSNPLTHDPLITLDISVENATASAALTCDAELFTYDIPAEPDATIAIAGAPFCEDATAVDIAVTPAPGELAFGSITLSINVDQFADEVGIAIYDATGTLIGFLDQGTLAGAAGSLTPFTFPISDILLSTAAQPIGTYTVGASTATAPISMVLGDAFGDGWITNPFIGNYTVLNGATSGGAALVPNTNAVASVFSDANVLFLNPNNYTSPAQTAPIAINNVTVDYILQSSATIAGAGTANGPVVVGVIPQFDPTAAGPGEHAITYTYTDPNGCADVLQTYVDVYEKPILGTATVVCNADGTYNVTIPATNISTATWNAIKDATAVGSDVSNTPAGENTQPLAALYTNDGLTNAAPTSFAVTTTAGTLGAATIAADGSIVISNIPGATASINVTLGTAAQPGCDATLTVNKPCICPVITNGAGTYCGGATTTGTVFATWQAAVATANPTATIVYSAALAVDGTTPPNGTLISLAANTTCDVVSPLQYAYHICDNATPATADDTYILLGTYTLTNNPQVQAGSAAAAVGCAVTVTKNCTTDIMVASAPTGGALVANFDAATGTYTAASGAAAGGLTITFSNASNCGTPTLTLTTPACPLPCAITSILPTLICCYDNGTPADNTDDEVTYNITVNYTDYVVAGGAIVLDPTSVGGAIITSTPIGTASGSFTFENVVVVGVQNADITAIFNDNLACTAVQNINQNGCTSVCNIIEAIVSPMLCNDNGTPLVSTDDYYEATVYIIYENTVLGTTFTLSGATLSSGGVISSAATTANSGTLIVSGVRVNPSTVSGAITVTNTGVGADAACTQGSLPFSTGATCSVPIVLPVCGISIQSDCATTCSVNASGNSVYSVTLVVLTANPAAAQFQIANNGTNIGTSFTVPDADGVTEVTINNLPSDGAIDNFTAFFPGALPACSSPIYPITAPVNCTIVCPPAASTTGTPR